MCFIRSFCEVGEFQYMIDCVILVYKIFIVDFGVQINKDIMIIISYYIG